LIMGMILLVQRPTTRSICLILTLAFSLTTQTRDAVADCATASPCALAPTILGSLATNSIAEAVNSNGTVVVGELGFSAVRWVGGVSTNLGSLGGSYSGATSVNGDGSVIVGYSYLPGLVSFNGVNYNAQHAFRWTNAGMVDLGTLGGPVSGANGVSSSGSVVVGYSYIGGLGPLTQHAFRWTSGTGMVDLGTLGGSNSTAQATNSDGTTVIGTSELAGNTAAHAFRWTSAGMADLGTLGGTKSFGRGVNGDGSVVVGDSQIAGTGSYHAFRWTSAGMTDLGTLGGTHSHANGVSADGAVVVGDSGLTGNPTGPAPFPGAAGFPISHAFRWTAATGIRDLNALLVSAGVNMNGITLTGANGISGDGKFIVGNATVVGSNPNHGYIVKYDDGARSISAGVTTVSAQQTSVDQLSEARTGALAQQGAFATPLLGADKPISNTSEVGAFASAGSAAGGGFMRFSSANGVSLLAGVSYAQEDYPDAELRHSVMGALALQYALDVRSWWRPYVEVGGWIAPDAALSFSRTYANGAGTATGVGETHARLSYVYARGGVIFDHGKSDQLVVAAEVGREKASVDGYTEGTEQNPFNASVAAGSDQVALAKVRLQWSHRFNQTFDTSLWVAGVHGFNRDSSVVASIGGIGTLSAANLDSVSWAEYGARIGFKVTDAITLDTFVNGVSGGGGIDTRVHGGIGVRTHF
jgi:probable HAF family extracellular repeat protein